MFGWWSRRKRNKIAAQIEKDVPAATKALKDKWLYFNGSVKFQDSVPLKQQVSSFLEPAMIFLSKHHPALLKGPPEIIPNIFVIALVGARTHDPDEIYAACRQIWGFLPPPPPPPVRRNR